MRRGRFVAILTTIAALGAFAAFAWRSRGLWAVIALRSGKL